MLESPNNHAADQTLDQKIYAALQHPFNPNEQVESLAKHFEHENLSPQDFESLSYFLIAFGRSDLLLRLCLQKLADQQKIPWGHFLEAFKHCMGEIPTRLREALLEGATEFKLREELSRSHALDSVQAEFPQLRRDRRQQFSEKHHFIKKDLLVQVDMLRSQELDKEEDIALQRLLRLFPRDSAISRLKDDLQRRKALRLLDEKIQNPGKFEGFGRIELDATELAAAEPIAKSMAEVLTKEIQWTNDFAIAWIFMDSPDHAMKFVRKSATSSQEAWLEIEILLQCRKHAMALQRMNEFEHLILQQSEGVYGLQYMKAVCLWEIGQRFPAIEVLTALVEHRPQHRNAASLLFDWKNAGPA
jgi:hypothetical protein